MESFVVWFSLTYFIDLGPSRPEIEHTTCHVLEKLSNRIHHCRVISQLLNPYFHLKINEGQYIDSIFFKFSNHLVHVYVLF